MDKISSIIHGSPRVQSVDMHDSAPVRPGSPSFGRPDNSKKSEEKAAAIAKAMTEKFSPPPPPPPATQATVPAEVSAQATLPAPITGEMQNVQMPSAARLESLRESMAMDNEMAAKPSELYPRGSFVDLQA